MFGSRASVEEDPRRFMLLAWRRRCSFSVFSKFCIGLPGRTRASSSPWACLPSKQLLCGTRHGVCVCVCECVCVWCVCECVNAWFPYTLDTNELTRHTRGVGDTRAHGSHRRNTDEPRNHPNPPTHPHRTTESDSRLVKSLENSHIPIGRRRDRHRPTDGPCARPDRSTSNSQPHPRSRPLLHAADYLTMGVES